MTSAEHELQRARFAARFPRAVATMRAQAVAAVFASAARELEDLAGCSHASTLFRKIRGIVAATVEAAVNAEGDEL
jgi:hypothetical protein